jgi:ketosteroid isomerase-like protein
MNLRHLCLIPVVGGLLLLTACSNPFAPTGTSATPTVSPEVKAAVDQYVAKVNAHDAPGAGEFYADEQDFHWVENGVVTYETRTAAISGLTNFFGGFPESHFEAYEVKVSMLTDESAVATFKYTQTIAANGQDSIKFEGTMTLSMAVRDGDWKIIVGHRSTGSFPH